MFASPTLAQLTTAPFQVGRPLFGSQWLALLAALAGIAVLLGLVALLGRWLAATHPAPPVVVTSTTVAEPVPNAGSAFVTMAVGTPTLVGDVPAELVPVIIAAVAAGFDPRARVTLIRPYVAPVVTTPSLEALMQHWSYEGRRQIYSSHKVR